MSTNTRNFQRRFTGEGVAVVGVMILVGLYAFALVKMIYAIDADNHPKAIFWLLVLLGFSVEQKLSAIHATLTEIKWRR